MALRGGDVGGFPLACQAAMKASLKHDKIMKADEKAAKKAEKEAGYPTYGIASDEKDEDEEEDKEKDEDEEDDEEEKARRGAKGRGRGGGLETPKPSPQAVAKAIADMLMHPALLAKATASGSKLNGNGAKSKTPGLGKGKEQANGGGGLLTAAATQGTPGDAQLAISKGNAQGSVAKVAAGATECRKNANKRKILPDEMETQAWCLEGPPLLAAAAEPHPLDTAVTLEFPGVAALSVLTTPTPPLEFPVVAGGDILQHEPTMFYANVAAAVHPVEPPAAVAAAAKAAEDAAPAAADAFVGAATAVASMVPLPQLSQPRPGRRRAAVATTAPASEAPDSCWHVY